MSTDPTGELFTLRGRTAPDFTLPKPEGEFLSLQELRGRKVLLVFLRHFA
ncbi:MAG: redoxin domain-containing protein [SAR202 cluster bacterium]|nr:redoxin domain-containing protein [SAR202 cluster bacterium]